MAIRKRKYEGKNLECSRGEIRKVNCDGERVISDGFGEYDGNKDLKAATE